MKQGIIFALGLRSVANHGALAIFACLLLSPDTLAQQINTAPPLGVNVPRISRAPAAPIKQRQTHQIPTQSVGAPANLNKGGRTPLSRTDRPRIDRQDAPGVGQAPSAVVQPARPRPVVREVARRVNIAGDVLVLPEVAYYGVPVILNVPDLGYVDVPEDQYAQLYKQLSSSDQEQIDSATATLRAIKAAETAEVEALQNGPRLSPGDVARDLSDRISFGRPSKINEPSQRLY
jgi:hypothetical protein